MFALLELGLVQSLDHHLKAQESLVFPLDNFHLPCLKRLKCMKPGEPQRLHCISWFCCKELLFLFRISSYFPHYIETPMTAWYWTQIRSDFPTERFFEEIVALIIFSSLNCSQNWHVDKWKRFDNTPVEKSIILWFESIFRAVVFLFLDPLCFLFHLICCCWQLLWALVCRQRPAIRRASQPPLTVLSNYFSGRF